tara:strand:- start:992 stop:1498 length:507 start_codon:yes stop_codon:yes gene_type:complete
MTYTDYFVIIFFILLFILLLKDINTPRPQNQPMILSQIIYSLFSPINLLNLKINTIKDYETYDYSSNDYFANQDLNDKNVYQNNFNNILQKFNFIIFVFLFIFIIIPFIIYISKNNHYAIPISLFIIIILLIGPVILNFFLKIILFIFATPKNYLYNTKKRKKNIITI